MYATRPLNVRPENRLPRKTGASAAKKQPVFWTQERCDAARRAGHYMKAYNPVGGVKAKGTLTLIGAVRRWEDPQYADTIYLPTHRIAGSAEDVQSMLEASGCTAESIAAGLKTAWTRDNYRDEELFLQDCRRDHDRVEAIKSKIAGAGDALSPKLAEVYKELRSTPRSSIGSAANATDHADDGAAGVSGDAKSKKRNKPAVTGRLKKLVVDDDARKVRSRILDRIDKLGDDELIDCSKLSDRAKMTPLNTISRSASCGLVVVGKICSDNLDTYKALVEFLGSPFSETYAEFAASFDRMSEAVPEPVAVPPPATRVTARPVPTTVRAPISSGVRNSSPAPVARRT